MPRFRYVAHKKDGKKIVGEQDAADEAALIRSMQGQEFYLTQVMMAGQEMNRMIHKSNWTHKKTKLQDLRFFARELAVLIRAGVPFDHALSLVTGQLQSESLARALTQIRAEIKTGSSFYGALKRYPGVFPVLWANLMEAGESTGDIAGVLDRISTQLEMAISLRTKVRSALIYPSILIVVTIIAVMVFLLFVIPKFAEAFKNLNAKLPPLTQAVLDISQVAQKFFFPVATFLGIGIFLTIKYFKTARGRRQLDLILLRMPVIGDFVTSIVMNRIASNMALVLSSGVPMIYGMEIVSRVCGNKIYEDALYNVTDAVRNGEPLSSAMRKAQVFPELMLQMLVVGEESGHLPDMVENAAKYYENRVNTSVERVSALVGPLIISILGVFIGGIFLALMLPIVTVAQNLKIG